MRCVIVVLAALLVPSVASAQAATGVFGEYVYAHPDFEDVHVSTGDTLNGWLGGVDVPVGNRFGLTARADGSYGDAFHQGVVSQPSGDQFRSALYTVTAGPRVSLISNPRSTVFVDGLFGVVHGRASPIGVDFTGVIDDTTFVGGGGGGLDIHLSRLIDVRVDAQYRRTNLFDQTLNLVHVGAGVVFRLTRR